MNIRTILLISLSNLGDIILTTPVLEKLHYEFPGAVIDVITGACGKDLFENYPAVRNVETHEKHQNLTERMKQVFKLRKEKYDLVVDLKNSLIPYLAGARFHSSMPSARESAGMHKREEHLRKLEGLVTDPFVDNKFFMPVNEQEREYVDSLIDPDWKRFVVINPGAKSHLKRWDARKYAKLADKIISELMCRVLLTGNADDEETIGHVMASITTPVKDLCDQTSLGALAELMKRADLVITNDSAPLHVASAVNAPTVVIFGPSDEKKYGPLSDKNRVIKPEIPCRPCGKALCSEGPVEGCISRITVEEVFNVAKEMLS